MKFKVNKTNLVGPNSALPKDPKFYLLLITVKKTRYLRELNKDPRQTLYTGAQGTSIYQHC